MLMNTFNTISKCAHSDKTAKWLFGF